MLGARTEYKGSRLHTADREIRRDVTALIVSGKSTEAGQHSLKANNEVRK